MYLFCLLVFCSYFSYVASVVDVITVAAGVADDAGVVIVVYYRAIIDIVTHQ